MRTDEPGAWKAVVGNQGGNEVSDMFQVVDTQEAVLFETESGEEYVRLTKEVTMDDEEKNEMWDFLMDIVGVSEETLQVVTSINGFSMDALNDVLYATTGYRNRDQYEEADED